MQRSLSRQPLLPTTYTFPQLSPRQRIEGRLQAEHNTIVEERGNILFMRLDSIIFISQQLHGPVFESDEARQLTSLNLLASRLGWETWTSSRTDVNTEIRGIMQHHLQLIYTRLRQEQPRAAEKILLHDARKQQLAELDNHFLAIDGEGQIVQRAFHNRIEDYRQNHQAQLALQAQQQQQEAERVALLASLNPAPVPNIVFSSPDSLPSDNQAPLATSEPAPLIDPNLMGPGEVDFPNFNAPPSERIGQFNKSEPEFAPTSVQEQAQDSQPRKESFNSTQSSFDGPFTPDDPTLWTIKPEVVPTEKGEPENWMEEFIQKDML